VGRILRRVAPIGLSIAICSGALTLSSTEAGAVTTAPKWCALLKSPSLYTVQAIPGNSSSVTSAQLTNLLNLISKDITSLQARQKDSPTLTTEENLVVPIEELQSAATALSDVYSAGGSVSASSLSDVQNYLNKASSKLSVFYSSAGTYCKKVAAKRVLYILNDGIVSCPVPTVTFWVRYSNGSVQRITTRLSKGGWGQLTADSYGNNLVTLISVVSRVDGVKRGCSTQPQGDILYKAP
jgi:hypothetical protein